MMLFLQRLVWFALAFLPTIATADDEKLPPRSEWRATSSSVETPAMAAAFAIDGDDKTRWGGSFSPGHWLQIDLGRPASIGGALIHWDSGFAAAYFIQSSLDGQAWTNAYETSDSQGGIDYVFFPAVRARYLRLASVPRTADWGVSVFEFEPLAAHDAPQIAGISEKNDATKLWSSSQPQKLVSSEPNIGTYALNIKLPRALPIAGLEVFWGAERSSAKLEARNSSGKWQTLAEDPDSLGETSYLAAREPQTVNELRLIVKPVGGDIPSIRRLRLLSPLRVMTPMRRYEIAASRANRELFPSSLHAQQVYWTVVGIPAARQKSVFDEYGDIEAFKGAPLVQPLWRDSSGHTVAAYGASIKHSLRDKWMPMPALEWSPQPGLQWSSEAIAIEQDDAPITLLRHSLRNTGTSRIDGQISLVVRPMQMNPPWQNGGISPIRDVAIENSAVRVNGRVLLQSLTPVDAGGASAFGIHGEDEITRYVSAGSVPKTLSAHDDDGLAAAMLTYNLHLEPGARREIVIAFPLGKQRIDTAAVTLPEAPSIDQKKLIDAGFDALADQVAKQWQARLGHVGLSLPDHSLVDMLRAQSAYMLINQTGPAMQAGPRNYNRSFIRDGAATAAILLRMGMAQTARDYLRWYADHAVHENGLVSPILNEDGSVNRGFGSDIEFDSQGEFIWLIAEVARLDGGAASVRDYLPKVKLALEFLQQLRERTLVPGYMADREAPERFRGIIAPSISHEGYSTPTHSYWDDYWALKGWHDGAWLADAWGDHEMARWAREQYSALRESLRASMRATMTWKHADFIPAAADLGDGDPTGVSIGLDPAGQHDLLPADALERTFARYLDDVRQREAPGSLYAYTPYELRNVLTYVHLNRPQDAEELLNNLARDSRPVEWHVFAEVVHSRLRHPGYLGDMPHTWIGSEYVRAIFGMLIREDDDCLQLLPGTPPSWVAGEGLHVSDLPTAYGTLSMTARQQGKSLHITLEKGLRKETSLQISWPSRNRPTRVSVDGKMQSDFSADGIRLDKPFHELVAQW
jgi:F5/8 type C domain-containing protein